MNVPSSGAPTRSIVINREYGSGGREIGRRIAERTGMEFYDSRILAEAAGAFAGPVELAWADASYDIGEP